MSNHICEKMYVYLKQTVYTTAFPASDLTSNWSRYLKDDSANPPNATARWIKLMKDAASS